MADLTEIYIPSGELQGDTKDLPMRGNKTGLQVAMPLPGISETVSYAKFKASSDSMDECYADDPLNPDADDDMGGNGSPPALVFATGSMGRMTGTGSDAMDDNVPSEQKI